MNIIEKFYDVFGDTIEEYDDKKFAAISDDRCIGLGYFDAFEQYNPHYLRFTVEKVPDQAVVQYNGHYFSIEILTKVLSFLDEIVEIATIMNGEFLLFKFGRYCFLFGEKVPKKDFDFEYMKCNWNEIFTEIKNFGSDMVL